MSITQSRPRLARWRTRALETVGDGPGSGAPVLVLLHGFGDHAGTWLPVLRELDRVGVRAVALDLPNFGEADAAGSGPVLDALDAFVAAAVEHWTEDGVAPVLVGNSLGAAASLRAAHAAPTSVSGIVLISPAGFAHAWFLDVLEKYSRFNPLMFTPVVPMRVFRDLTARGFVWAATGGGSRVPRGTARAMAAHFRGAGDVHRIFGCAPEVLAELRAWAAQRPTTTTPCLVLWGRHDRLVKVAGAAQIAAEAPTAEVRILEGSGHCAQLNEPGLVVSEVLRFRASLGRSAVG